MLSDSPPQAGFQLDGVGYRYPGQQSAVLNEITLDLPQFQFYALVGPSGSGKSTLLRLLAGIDQPTTGKVRWGGREVKATVPRDRHFGIVFQDAPLFPERTVEAVVRFPLDSGRTPRTGTAEQSVNQALEMLGLLAIRNRHPSTLSGGERQRVALARLLVWTPKVMLLDEPLSAVDHDRRPDLIRLLRDIQRKSQSTVVYVTHDQIDVFAAADKVAVLTGATIRHIDVPENVYREPSTVLVGRLIGDGSLSLIRGRLFLGDGERGVVTISPEFTVLGKLRRPRGGERTITSGEVSVGFRPEDIQLMSGLQVGNSLIPPASFRAVVCSCFFVGSRYLVKINATVGTFFVWHHERLQPEHTIHFSVKSSGLPLFDVSSDRLIGILDSADS